MATTIRLKHKESGVIEEGYFGYSWTVLFFSGLPILLRGDIKIFFLIWFAESVFVGITFPLFPMNLIALMLFNAFVKANWYNAYYTRKLLVRGYEFFDSEAVNIQAAKVLGVVYTPANTEENIKCPYCAELINSAANICKHCDRIVGKDVRCDSCSADLRLDHEDIQAGSYVCPKCESANSVV